MNKTIASYNEGLEHQWGLGGLTLEKKDAQVAGDLSLSPAGSWIPGNVDVNVQRHSDI